MIQKILNEVFAKAEKWWDQQSLKYQKEVKKRASLTIRLPMVEKEKLIALARERQVSLSNLIRKSLP